MDRVKQNLITLIESEANRLKESGFDDLEHREAIEYLRTGKVNHDTDIENELIQSIVYDYKTVVKDYGADVK